MEYTKSTLRADLEKISVASWDWPGATPGSVNPEVRALNPLAAKGGLEEIVEYCWRAYRASLTASGHLVIGRVPHLGASGAGLYEKVADIVEEDMTLFSSGAQGNLLKMDKWCRAMNDSWILGGVHRQALFRLASPRLVANLWNANGYFIVTAREILGLLHFGYQLEQVGPWQCAVCKNPVRATTADLIKYHRLIEKKQTVEEAKKLEDQAGSSARVQSQIRSFGER